MPKTTKEFLSNFYASIPSMYAVARYLRKQGMDAKVGDVKYHGPKSFVDDGDIWVYNEAGERDFRVEVRQLTQESFTCAEDFRHDLMVVYFVTDWEKMPGPRPKWVFVVNKEMTHAAQVDSSDEATKKWWVTEAPKYSSYAVPKNLPPYIEL